jgi:hypothetical protein
MIHNFGILRRHSFLSGQFKRLQLPLEFFKRRRFGRFLRVRAFKLKFLMMLQVRDSESNESNVMPAASHPAAR